jgi:hypothetical protein
MAITKLEKQMRHERRRKGLLVPLLEDLFRDPVEIESYEDVEWLERLLNRMLTRQLERDSAPLYSPSQLAGCLRYVYLLKHRKELGLKKVGSKSASAHYYFFNGNFLHLKWQFALHKLDQKTDPLDFQLLGVEVPVVSKRGDHGGTVDALVSIQNKLYLVDFKGLNVRSFQEIARGFIPPEYVMQLADYGMLYNSLPESSLLKTATGHPKIFTGLLVSENKGGADAKHPLALQETQVEIATHLPNVRGRLKELREYSEKEEIPPPECQSTGIVQFTGCPFRKFCKEEVKAIERARRDASRKDAEGLKVEVPRGRRNHRSRGNSKRR